MMKKGLLTGILTAVVVLLLLVTAVFALYFSSTVSKQEQKINELQNSLNLLQLNYDALQSKYNTLSANHDRLKEDYQSLQVSTRETQVEVEKAADKLEEFERTVRESMSWFTSNNNLNSTNTYIQIKDQLKKECLNTAQSQDVCEIKLDCIYNVNQKNGISYKTDVDLASREDFLQSLDLIYKNKGGDCEDISLLFTAEYNFLADECENEGFDRDKIKASTHSMTFDGSYMYVVCGGFNPIKYFGIYEYVGHCVVALTESPILTSVDVYKNLKSAPLIEPQTGEFMFYIDQTDITYLFKDGEPPNTLYQINMVITDDDLKVFYPWAEQVRWIGFEEFLKDIQPLKEKIAK